MIITHFIAMTINNYYVNTNYTLSYYFYMVGIKNIKENTFSLKISKNQLLCSNLESIDTNITRLGHNSPSPYIINNN